MSVSLNPSSTLGFNRPLTELVKRTLTITNNNALPVAFKVKTTAPKLYCVRPNAGRIEPGDSVAVSVQLQPMKEEPALTAKCKDKFLVQSTAITTDKEHLSLSEIWASPAGGESDMKINQQKLRVVYLPPEGVVEEEPEDPTQSRVEDSRLYETVRQQPSHTNGAIPTFDTSARHQSVSPHRDDSFVAAREEQSRVEERHESRISPSPEPRQPSPGPIVNVNVHTPPVPVPEPSPPSGSMSNEPSARERELVTKLAEAQQEILRLRSLLSQTPDTSEVKHRGPKSDDTAVSDADAVSEAGTFIYRNPLQEGASPQQVGIIALLVFIITYLFF